VGGEVAGSKKMKKQDSATKAAFDPIIGSAAALSWWELGKWLAHRDDPKNLTRWQKRMIADVDPFEAKAITVSQLQKFADNVYGLLKRKYAGEPIAREVAEKVAKAAAYQINDAKQYLAWNEPGEVFWANEYRFIFMELREPDKSAAAADKTGWLQAVGTCGQCGEFFVRSRRDQRFDKIKCRNKANNDLAYKQFREKKTGRRGR
jgi:hypothetical protein